jgi:hypothetical protein
MNGTDRYIFAERDPHRQCAEHESELGSSPEAGKVGRCKRVEGWERPSTERVKEEAHSVRQAGSWASEYQDSQYAERGEQNRLLGHEFG